MVFIIVFFISRTPLMAAAKKGRTDVCEWLLKKGADRNFTDVQGIKQITSLSHFRYQMSSRQSTCIKDV